MGAEQEHTRLTHRLRCGVRQARSAGDSVQHPLLPHLSAMAVDRMQFPARGRPGGWSG